MNSFSISKSILMSIFYIGYTIASFYCMLTIRDTHQLHDTIHVKELNCSCSPDDTQFQCVHEADRMGRSMYKTSCKKLEVPGEPTKYQFCYCTRTRIKSSQCVEQACHWIDNPLNPDDIPKKCANEKCDTCDALEMWILTARIGACCGVIAIVFLSLMIYKAVRNSDENIDFSKFLLIHVVAIILPAAVGFSLLTTGVLTHYSDVRLNMWAWTMLFGFGMPLLMACVYNIRDFIQNKKCKWKH